MPDKLHNVEEVLHDIQEGLSEKELIAHSEHKKRERVLLYIRNCAAGVAAVLFLLSIFHVAGGTALKAVAYFFGAGAYLSEILLLTDCFKNRVPHEEMFMAYCFGPIYILLGISYLLH